MVVRMCEFLELPDTHAKKESGKDEVKKFVLSDFDRDTVEAVFNILEQLIEHYSRQGEKGFISIFKSIFT
jgi:hypothetical protein